MPCAPGDVKTYDWLIECKTHAEPDKPILFNLDVWKKIENEAMGMQRKPVLIVDDGSQSINKTWCLCRASNINLRATISTQLPMTIRKNISCKHDKLESALKQQTKGAIGEFYTNAVFEVNWGDEEVVVLPFCVFKEIFED